MAIREQLARAGASARSALSFSHLSSVGGIRAADEDEDKKKKDEEARKAEDEKKKDDEARVAEDKDDKKDASEGDDDDEDKKKKDASEGDDDEDEDKKKKNAAAAEDDDEEEMHGNSAAARARRRERARCAAIFSAKEAGAHPELAARLAFNTTMPRHEALAVLKGLPAQRNVREARQNANPRLGPGGNAETTTPAAIASSWDKAMDKTGSVNRKKAA